ncbi:efflux RND transporter permease subunit [Propionispora vibrioides]|uniref:Multidrug efflux pump subunit AcrB n=1 Tax=Propionispora vibrioides TaxID=112903 RepID=A0A1H8VYP7_9FIRM|nr:efflux RND transporter permease subunit [Propionispora vibrioides]SEP20519.1 Multidrug efflux pump subunit AcrB [Propionispora vibrioides]
MKGFNLTEWSLNHKQVIYFFMILFFIAGFVSYQKLGRMEDPDFTIKQMIVSAAWPGATAKQMEEQVTDKIEKKLQDLPGLDYLKSYSTPGTTVIYVHLKDSILQKEVRGKWLEVRNMVNDIAGTLPTGVTTPQFNDRFDEVYGVVFALTGDGYTYEDMRVKAERIRRILLGVPSVKKVNLLGVQTEKIYVEVENNKLAQLGIDPTLITSTLQAQNAMSASGMLETTSDNIYLRVTGMFENLEDVKNTPIQANGRTFRLGDIATVTRSYSEPSDPKFYYNGEPSVGISLAMEPGGNVLTLGENIAKTIEQVKKELPAGMEIHQTVNQPKVVESSIDEFVESLFEAIVIVLIVSFISLGVHSGIIVALCIPLVIAIVFTFMNLFSIDLQRISLGALIIALGLLVDDAIITIETMVVKLEQGWSRFNAACFAYSSTAYPRLTGELVTCAGFIPVGFAVGSASEYCVTIFTVVTISLLTSWIVAGTATPLLGYLFIKIKPKNDGETEHDPYDTVFYQKFKKLLVWCMTHKKIVLGMTVGVFIVAVSALGLVKQQFFPASTRSELIVQLELPEGSSLKNMDAVACQFAQELEGDPQISYYTYHVGEGAPRFVLSFDPTANKTNFSEFIIVAKDYKARDELQKKYRQVLINEFSDVQFHTKVINNGPTSDYPVMLRVKGYDVDKVREIAEQVQTVMAANPHTRNVNLKWSEKSKIAHLSIDQDKVRKLGITSQTLASALQMQQSGTDITQFREDDKTVNMLLRFDAQDRNNPAEIKNFNIPLGNGKYVPLDQIAKISFEAEDGLIYRRDLKPMIWIQAELNSNDVTGDNVAEQVYNNLNELRAGLPFGYSIEYDGPKEDSIKAVGFMMQPVPAMIIAIMILLIIQLQNIPKMILTLMTAPLGFIGVVAGLLITNSPMGFVVQLGMLALSGIIMRNTVILMDQIDQLLDNGEPLWDAIINATVIRLRPILLTAAAAILGMIPLVSSIFWGPMAIAIAAGLMGATILTLVVLPVMYAAWYRAKPNSSVQGNVTTGAAGPSV